MDKFTAELLKHAKKIKVRYDELCTLVVSPEIIADNRQLRRLTAELNEIEEIAQEYTHLRKVLKESEKISDKELKELLNAEITAHTDRLNALLQERNNQEICEAIIEIRTDGTEWGKRLAEYLWNTYRKWGRESQITNYNVQITNEDKLIKKRASSLSSLPFHLAKHERGVHRAIYGKNQTGEVTVGVYPKAEEIEIIIDEKDLRIDTYRSGGKGGQNVNKVESAVRIIHLPTGIAAACQDERSQLQNKDRAYKLLMQKLKEHYEEQKAAETEKLRKEQSTERIRTYDFPAGTVTDSRVSMTAKLEELGVIIDALTLNNN